MEKLTWHAAGLTDKGLVRSENQDNFSVSPDFRVFVVADGMGGTAGGALASRLAVEEMELCRKEIEMNLADPESVHKWLVQSIARANKKVKENAEKSKESSRMGTTIVAAVQDDNHTLHIAHVGDSRAYLVRDESPKMLTLDHSVVMEFYRRGQITMAQVATSPYRHLITRCLGHEHEVECDYTTLKVTPGDSIVLATDGLSVVVEDCDMAEAIVKASGPDQSCKELVKKTLAGGAPDNITVIVIQYQGAEKPLATTGSPESKSASLKAAADD